MSKIRQELVTAAGITPARGEPEPTFILRLQNAIATVISQETWDKLSVEAQDWNNAVADALRDNKDIPPFPDEEKKDEPAATPSRRRGAAAEPEKAAVVAFEPVLGAEVIYTSARGSVKQGIVVSIEADGVIINKDGEKGDQTNDEECDPTKGTFASAAKAEPEATPSRRGRGAAASSTPAKTVPEVGDTVEATTVRGKVVVGNVVYIGGEGNDDIDVEDSAGTKHEFSISKLASYVLKVDNAKPAAAATPATRGRGAAATPGEEPKNTRVRNGEISVGQRVREIVCEKAGVIEPEAVYAILTQEKIEFRDVTVKMIVKDTKTVIDLLKANKLLK